MRILWIEDIKSYPEKEIFPTEIIENYEICKVGSKFEEIVKAFDAKEIVKYDFFVIDLDLRKSDIRNSHSAKAFMQKLKINYTDEELIEKFIKEAGYHLAVELICRIGFPLERVVFVTGYANEIPGDFEDDLETIKLCIWEKDYERARNTQ